MPKLTLPGVIVSAACTPVPVRGITALAPAVLLTVTLPVTDSAAIGLNVRFSAAVCPGVNVIGVVIPLALVSCAFTVIWEMVILELPPLLTVTLLTLELPALTLPKPKLEGVAEIVTDAATPVPLSATSVGEFVALLVIVTLPLSAPAVVGANNALNVADFPASIVAGVASPLAL